MNEKNTNRIEKIVAFILGLIICNNVIYFFKIGRTYINISFVYGVAVFLFLVIVKKKNIKKCIKEINIYFRLFILCALVSIIPLIIVFYKELSLISSYFNGIIALLLCVFLYADVILLKEHKKDILKGLAIGFSLNTVLSLIQYVTFNNGNYFSLYTYFPQPAFQINSYFGVKNTLQNSLDTFNIYGYRAQGFFLETSYYFAFIAGTAIVLFVTVKNSIIKILSFFSVVFIIALTSSGNMIIIISTFIMFYVMGRIKKSKDYKDTKLRKKNILYAFFMILLFFLFFITNINKIQEIVIKNNVYDKFINNVNTANITNDGNKDRLNSMIKSLKLILKYPLGVGYNMSPTLLNLEYDVGELETNTTFNSLITIQLEEGILGTIVYAMYICNISIFLICKAKEKYTLALGIATFAIFICQIGNGIGFFPFVILMFALANIEQNELMSNKKDILE